MRGSVEAFGKVVLKEALSRSFNQLSFDLVDVLMGPPAGLRKLVICQVLTRQLKRGID